MTHNKVPRKIIIIGATSGIGKELALRYLDDHNQVGITGRRTDRLEEIKRSYPENTYYQQMDVCLPECVEQLHSLIEKMGGLDMIIYCSGVGRQNKELDRDMELEAVKTNIDGFLRIVIAVYHYFKATNQKGRIVTISSVAGIRPLKLATAYSATKNFQMHYMSCLAQKAYDENIPVSFTTIIPGFIQTDFLKEKFPLTVSLDKGSALIYKAIEKGKRKAILPLRWKFIVGGWKLIPGRLWEKYISRLI